MLSDQLKSANFTDFLASKDSQEGILAFLEKRNPVLEENHRQQLRKDR